MKTLDELDALWREAAPADDLRGLLNEWQPSQYGTATDASVYLGDKRYSGLHIAQIIAALPGLLDRIDAMHNAWPEVRERRDAIEATMQGCSARARAAAIEECAKVCDGEARRWEELAQSRHLGDPAVYGPTRKVSAECASTLAARLRALLEPGT
jgi:hypothetical protein